MMLEVSVNGRRIEASSGQTVLEAARDHGIEIPTLCYHPDLSLEGSCRLCLVEVDGISHEMVACCLKVEPGMVVRTETPRLHQARKDVLEMLLSRYHDAGYAPGDGEKTEFQHWVRRYGAKSPTDDPPRYPVNADPNPFVWVDLNKCILCTRCVRACAEVQGRFVWGVAGRGDHSRIVAGADSDMLSARCESCGACVAYCPTGALDDKPCVGRGRADKQVRTTCAYCGVGCTFDLNVKDGLIVRVTSSPDAPVNGMHLCVKGRYGYDFVHHAERLTRPRVRRYLLEGVARGDPGRGKWIDTDWDTALDIVARKLIEVRRQSSPNAIGILASAKCTNEENYLMQKFARQVLGTHNVDHCARLCHSSTVAGLAMAFGSGAMSNTMRDVAENARAIFVIGSNTTEQHPVFGTMLRQAVLKRGAKLVVADPRAIDLAEFALLHLRQRPGTDVALLNGLMHIIVKNEWHDREFIAQRTEGVEAFLPTLERYPPDTVAAITGISIAELELAAAILAEKPMAAIWAMGITQHITGVLNVLALANLQMLLGNLGVPGGGVNPLRGQNNVQGACDMGALPNVFPGYQSIADPAAREKLARAWALSGNATGLAAEPGLTLTELISAAGEHSIRALYILGENPVMTDPDMNHVRACLQASEFVVLQEIFPSETSNYADVLLPGAAWAEKDGTFTNTERRVQMVREALPPPTDSRADWRIICELARRVLALEAMFPVGPRAGWDYASPAAIMDEIAALTPSYAGVSHARLERGEQLFWPVPDANHPGTPILHVTQFTRGKGKFHVCKHLPAAELPDRDYPLILTTGRVLYHWHGGEMTRRSPGLAELCPDPRVEISPEDAALLKLVDGSAVRVASRRGEMRAQAEVTERVPQGVVFGNFHFPGEYNVNNLTIAALDPIAKIPEYKVCAVRVESD